LRGRGGEKKRNREVEGERKREKKGKQRELGVMVQDRLRRAE
jgi:hypothetical protein